MTYEQIFAGQMAVAMAIKHLRNRSMSLSNDSIRFSDRGGSYSMPKDQWDAVMLLEARSLELEREFQIKKSRKLKKVRP